MSEIPEVAFFSGSRFSTHWHGTAYWVEVGVGVWVGVGVGVVVGVGVRVGVGVEVEVRPTFPFTTLLRTRVFRVVVLPFTLVSFVLFTVRPTFPFTTLLFSSTCEHDGLFVRCVSVRACVRACRRVHIPVPSFIPSVRASSGRSPEVLNDALGEGTGVVASGIR